MSIGPGSVARPAVNAAMVALALLGLAPTMSRALAASVQLVVNGDDMPWELSEHRNKAFRFGVQDGARPAKVTLAKLHAEEGRQIVIQYVANSGTISVGSSYPQTDASGTDIVANDTNGDSGQPFPSKYMTPYPIYLGELVATFATRKDEIIGQPFAVGNGPVTVTVPLGAYRLQLGVNDDIFSDNTGSWTVSVSLVKQ